ANGIIDAKRAQTSDIQITDIYGSVNLTPEKALLENMHFKMPAADVEVKILNINMTVNPVSYSMEAKSSNVNMNYVLNGNQNGDMGPAQITLNLEGTQGQDSKGYGTLSLGEGKLPAAPVFIRIDAFLKGKNKLVGLPYKTVPTKYTLNAKRL